MPIGDHFYTTSETERTHAIAQASYVDEGIAAFVFVSGDSAITPLLRLFNPGNGDHFYTISEAERDGAVSGNGYVDEGIACFVFHTQQPRTIPLQRLHKAATGDHFYTISEDELSVAMTEGGYVHEGQACFVFRIAEPGTLPLHRLFHPDSGDHFYTVSDSERDAAIANSGYVSEGVACHVPLREPESIPLRRLFRSDPIDHFYTVDAQERDKAVTQFGYVDEGIACFVPASQLSGTTPFHRLLNPATGDHFYTISDGERDTAISNGGYISGGEACLVFAAQESGTAPLFRLFKDRMRAVTAFRPQTHGFPFDNHWTFDEIEKKQIHDIVKGAAPAVVAILGPLLPIGFGPLDALGLLLGIPPGVSGAAAAAALAAKLDDLIDAALPESYGLCGGMAFAALDYFHSGLAVPRSLQRPKHNTPEGAKLRDYIWSRLLDSLRDGAAQTTLTWMAILKLVPQDTAGSAKELLNRTKSEWKTLKQHLDKGEPWPIGLVGTTDNPMKNHQVVAYGYEDPGDGTGKLSLYDSNCPDRECVISLDFRGDQLDADEKSFGCPSDGRGALRGLFCEAYLPKPAPPNLS